MIATTAPPLWQKPIEVLGLTGEFASGKTLFSLTIAPGPDTLAFDLEKSNATYQPDLGFTRVDVPAQMLRVRPNGYKPADTFEWWLAQVRAVSPGRYRVIVLDPVSEIESGLADWVKANPAHFGRTAAQYAKSSGLMWGDVKEYWKAILADLASRCETFAFTSHMANVWERDGPTGKRKAKGKETLMELATLYLQLERKKDAKGNVPAKPAAVVLKSRLSSTRVDPATGDVETVPTLPPRLPEATPKAIRQWMEKPPDYANLSADMLAPEPTMTDDERAEMRLATARTELEAEQTRLARIEREQGRRAATTSATTAAPLPPPVAVPTPAAGDQAAAPSPAVAVATDAQLDQLLDLRARLFKTELVTSDAECAAVWSGVLAKRGVTSARQLTPAQADELIANLRVRLYGSEAVAGVFAGTALDTTANPGGNSGDAPDPNAHAAA